MKKKLFFFAAAAVALASCSSDDTIAENSKVANNQPQEIALFAVNQSSTRAAITGTTFPTDLHMNVSALDLTNDRAFFTPTEFAKGASYWEGSPKRYWPLSPVQVNFLAIANANATNPATDISWTTTGTQGSEAQSVQVVMADNYAVANQKDFMYAVGCGQVTQTGSALSIPEKVNMTFQHAQAYLVFQAKAANAASQNIKIKNILINGARTSGTATIARANAGTYGDEDINLNWTSTGYPSGGTAGAYNSITPTQAAFSPVQDITDDDYTEIGHLMVVPNMTAVNTYDEGGFTTFKIIYTLDEKDYEYVYTPTSTKLEAGKKYVYNITFNLHEILINPDVQDWDGDINNNDVDDDDVVVNIPEYTTLRGTNLTITANEAGKYRVKIADFGVDKAYTVAVTDADDIISVDPVAGTSDDSGSGVATITFNVKKHASAGDHTATITVTRTDNSSDTVITVNQTVE